ncbi:Dynein assembly factor 1, axonemal [Holothuria leucospilota]|uniref:Dynein assembly factor 1, axonemal n=1 Tax=Holothuria leucospilota TaxID=206669 RepID=A0A9Q1CUF5_HOLLE|nr:Dynein assembly factor 1, axonemal [Holothuria leucospilota]
MPTIIEIDDTTGNKYPPIEEGSRSDVPSEEISNTDSDLKRSKISQISEDLSHEKESVPATNQSQDNKQVEEKLKILDKCEVEADVEGHDGKHSEKKIEGSSITLNGKDDEDRFPRMTAKSLLDICKHLKLYRTPELNDVLYLHYKGFSKIENLDKYTGLKALYLECNGINRIENLDHQTELRCLYLQQNLISKLENLEPLVVLDTLNVSNNYITRIENIDCLKKLNTLQISHNRITQAEDLEGLRHCDYLSVVDLSHNRIEDPTAVEVFAAMKTLRVLNLMGNPVVKHIKNYRKTMILKCKNLTFLDDRPVFDKERACTEAWAKGGREAEKAERERWINKERAKIQASVDALSAIRARAEAARREKQKNGDVLAEEDQPKEIRDPETYIHQPPEDEPMFTFDVTKGPASNDRRDDTEEEKAVSEEDKEVEHDVKEDGERQIGSDSEEKINIDDLPDLEEIDVEEISLAEAHWAQASQKRPLIQELDTPVGSSPSDIPMDSSPSLSSGDKVTDGEKSSLIEEILPSSSNSNRPLIQRIYEETKPKSLVEEISSPVSDGRTTQRSLIEDLTLDEPCHSLDDGLSQNEDEFVNDSPKRSPFLITEFSEADSSGARSSGPLIQEIESMSEEVIQERESFSEFIQGVKGEGMRIPRSWHLLQEEKEKSLMKEMREEDDFKQAEEGDNLKKTDEGDGSKKTEEGADLKKTEEDEELKETKEGENLKIEEIEERDEQGLTAAQRQKIWELAEKAGSSAHQSEPLLPETQTVDALRKKYGGTGET